MSDFDNSNNSMLDMYLFESTSLLTQLDDILLESEKNQILTPDNINEIFRIMHTIKGSSAMMEFNIISSVSHKLEDLFYIIRDNGLSPEHFEDLFDLVLKVSDFLKEEVDKIQLNQPLCEENDALVSEILTFLNMLKSDAEGGAKPEAAPATQPAQEESNAASDFVLPEITAKPPTPAEVVDEVEVTLAESAAQERYIFARFTEGCQMENIRAFMLVTQLNSVGTVTMTNPEKLDGNPEACDVIINKGFYCAIISDKTDDEILSVANAAPSVASAVFTDNMGNGKPAAQKTAEVKSAAPAESAASEKPAATQNAGKAPAAAQAPAGDLGHVHKQNLISVDLSKLDALMDLVGEIVISESMVSGSPDLEGLRLENFEKAARQLRKLTTELQDIAMSIRMVPIAGTFQKMKRIVRDMSKKLDKSAELVLMGEATEVDKTIVDAIADPIMHLVRNSMDHGLETKEERAQTEKDPTARIILSAQNVGGDIIIAVSDDGRGLDAEKILAKAKEKGLHMKPEAELTEKDIFNFLMAPGFSTKEAVTEYSGRGVGMDVVKKNIEKIGGTVSIESVKGQGMTVYFKIPLTLAIIDSMEIRVGSNIYTLPITNIRESFKASSDEVFSDPNGNEMIMIRGACYPIIRLNRVFSVPDSVSVIDDGILLLVDSGESLACLLADELIGKHQVVVKPMPHYITSFNTEGSGISGCTIMGDGSISLILDVPTILANR